MFVCRSATAVPAAIAGAHIFAQVQTVLTPRPYVYISCADHALEFVRGSAGQAAELPTLAWCPGPAPPQPPRAAERLASCQTSYELSGKAAQQHIGQGG